jgi:hypothetical protein
MKKRFFYLSGEDGDMQYKCGDSRCILRLIWAICILTMLGDAVMAQTHLRQRDFLNLGSPEGYLNYGRSEYEPYPELISARNRYDRLGNFQMRGHKTFTWQLQRPGYSEISTRSEQYLGWFNNLVVMNDTYRGWNFGVTVGEDIRTKLTDLVFQDPRFFGIRMDGASADNRFTLLLSQGGSQATQSPNPKFSTFQGGKERSSVLLFGGHWETKLGSMLKLGTTYFNQHMLDTFNDKGSFIRGDTPYSMLAPSYIEVIVEDDSPESGQLGAVVYDVAIEIEAESMGQMVRMSSISGASNFDVTLQPMVEGGLLNADGGREVNGVGQRVIFTFKMPEFAIPDPASYVDNPSKAVGGGLSVKNVRFKADVAGDYRILVRQKHVFFDDKVHGKNVSKGYEVGNSKYVNPFTGLKGDDALLSPTEAYAAGEADIFKQWPVPPNPSVGQLNPFQQFKWNLENPEDVAYTVVRAETKETDTSNRRIVSFDYGIPTGQALFGLDGHLTLKGIDIKGEFTTNPQYFIYPVGHNAGTRFQKRSIAYFINAIKKVGSFDLGMEVFRLAPDYGGNYDSIRGGVPFFTDVAQTGSQMQEMFVMTDNDDNDQWPDELIVELPSADRQDSGIFPGLDENQDLVPDTDQNLNGIADWTEPIIFYDADPPEFVYGLDFNNNGVVDFRENDGLPDYPYRRDRRGMHVFSRKSGLGAFGNSMSVGFYDTEEIAGPGQAKALYARYEYSVNSPYLGRIRFNDDIKRVEDHIRDDVYIWRDRGTHRIDSPYPHLTPRQIEERDLNSQIMPPDRDPLTMRNSLVNTMFIEGRTTPIVDLNLINNFQWIRNSQAAAEFDDGVIQDEDVRSFITLVNKIDYTFRAGNITIKPMFKHLLLREHSQKLDREVGSGSTRSFSIYTPILRSRFDLTNKSYLQLGFQGLPFWRYTKLDRVDSTQDFKEWTTVFMMTNRSDYYGFALSSQIGWETTRRDYSDENSAALNRNASTLFFDIIAGF